MVEAGAAMVAEAVVEDMVVEVTCLEEAAVMEEVEVLDEVGAAAVGEDVLGGKGFGTRQYIPFILKRE